MTASSKEGNSTVMKVVAREARRGGREGEWWLHTCHRGEGTVRKREGRQERMEMVQTEDMRTEEMARVMWW